MGDPKKLEVLALAMGDALVVMRALEAVHASLRTMHAECGWPDACEIAIDALGEFVRGARESHARLLGRYTEEVSRG